MSRPMEGTVAAGAKTKRGFQPARIIALDAGEETNGWLLKDSRRTMQVEADRPLPPGTPVEISTESELLLGEIIWSSDSERMRVTIEHSVALASIPNQFWREVWD